MAPKAKDYAGIRFGYSVVVCPGPRAPAPSLQNQWWCICDCGECFLRSVSNLKKSRSCGCQKAEICRRTRKGSGIDYTGEVFGTRKVLGVGPDLSRRRRLGSRDTGWRCICTSCQKTSVVDSGVIAAWAKRGTQCRCLSRQPSEAFVLDLVRSAYPDTLSEVKGILSGYLELDVYVPSLKAAVEVDGPVHDIFPKRRAHDARRVRDCEVKGISLLRIRAERVAAKPEEAKAEILQFLKGCAR